MLVAAFSIGALLGAGAAAALLQATLTALHPQRLTGVATRLQRLTDEGASPGDLHILSSP